MYKYIYVCEIEYPRAVKSWAIIASNKDRAAGEGAFYDRKAIAVRGSLASNNKKTIIYCLHPTSGIIRDSMGRREIRAK